MRKITVAITQMASDTTGRRTATRPKPWCARRQHRVRSLVLLQELFDADYFCIEQHVRFLRRRP